MDKRKNMEQVEGSTTKERQHKNKKEPVKKDPHVQQKSKKYVCLILVPLLIVVISVLGHPYFPEAQHVISVLGHPYFPKAQLTPTNTPILNPPVVDPPVVNPPIVDPPVVNPSIVKGIRIFVIGKSGTGKTTLTYGLLGLSSEEIERKTQAMSSTGISTEEINARGIKVDINMWASPEQDKTEPNDNVIEKIREVDFILLTLRMDDTRMRPGDKTILRKLGRIFGTDVWKKTVVALTYANRVDYIEDKKQKKSKSHLEKRKAEWINATHAVLAEENIPHDLMCSIPMLPAGYYKTPKLYDESWRDILVSGILSRVGEEAKKSVKTALKLEVEETIPRSFCPKD